MTTKDTKEKRKYMHLLSHVDPIALHFFCVIPKLQSPHYAFILNSRIVSEVNEKTQMHICRLEVIMYLRAVFICQFNN